MRRFFVPPELSRDDVFELPEREARHAVQVLRLGVDDELTVLDGAGGEMTCRIESSTRRTVRVAVLERRQRPPLPCAITLVQAVPKGPAFETIVQKATELGAARIIPLLSERVVAHVSEKDSSAKVEKWRQIAIESIKQCGSPWLPVIEAPVRFDRQIEPGTSGAAAPAPGVLALAGSEVPRAERDRPKPELQASNPSHTPTLAMVCSLEETKRTLREAVTEYQTRNQSRPARATIWIGPEGDFTPAEYAALTQSGAISISLGPLILRADTAAIACLAVANHELQRSIGAAAAS